MGGGERNVTQTSTYQLSPEQREMLGLAMPGIREFSATVPQRYPGSTIAGFNPLQTAAQGAALGAAGQQGQLAGQATGSASRFYTDMWNPESNTALQGAINASTRPIMENLTETALPAIRGEAVKTGNFGGSRQGIAEGIASREASRAVGDTASKLTQSTYDTNVNSALKALGLLPTIQQGTIAPATTVGAVGDVMQSMQQARLTEDAQNFMYDQYAPFLQSKEIASLINAIPGGTNVSQSSGGGSSGLTQGIGAGLTGLSLLGGSGGIGALLPFLFSDRRVKTDVRRVGNLDNGLSVYAFKYSGDASGTTHIGLMAQEVEKLYPDAVFELGGIKVVNYDEAVR